jgi:hypothetical protein
LLVALFAIWVISPFAILAVGYVVSKRWPALTQAALYGATLAVAAISVVIYGTAALGAARPKTPVFVIVAPASWLLVAVVVAIAAVMARRATASVGAAKKGSG